MHQANGKNGSKQSWPGYNWVNGIHGWMISAGVEMGRAFHLVGLSAREESQ
jgi:hypothetical protein